MVSYVAMLLRAIREYRLVDRYPELAQYEMLADMGRLSERMARAILSQLQDIIEHCRDFPSFLHRAPAEEQLMAGGPADIEFLTLAEGNEKLRYGIKLLDRVRHVLVAGATGSGKTTVIRNIIFGVHEHNLRELAEQ